MMEVELKEGKDVKQEMRKMLDKQEAPKGKAWKSWWKKQWKRGSNFQAEVHPDHNKSSWTEPARQNIIYIGFVFQQAM